MIYVVHAQPRLMRILCFFVGLGWGGIAAYDHIPRPIHVVRSAAMLDGTPAPPEDVISMAKIGMDGAIECPTDAVCNGHPLPDSFDADTFHAVRCHLWDVPMHVTPSRAWIRIRGANVFLIPRFKIGGAGTGLVCE